jgi:hypothetical protein
MAFKNARQRKAVMSKLKGSRKSTKPPQGFTKSHIVKDQYVAYIDVPKGYKIVHKGNFVNLGTKKTMVVYIKKSR